jgi:hypothetical protein
MVLWQNFFNTSLDWVWFCDFTLFSFASCAIFHLYHGEWGSIFLPNTYTPLTGCVMSLHRRPLYYLHQDVTIFVRVKNISRLISTYSLCQGYYYGVIMAWVLGLILRLFNNAVLASVVVRAEWDEIRLPNEVMYLIDSGQVRVWKEMATMYRQLSVETGHYPQNSQLTVF